MRRHLDGVYLNFQEAVERIRTATGVKTQTDLALLLGIRQATVSEAKKRGNIPAEWIIKLYKTRGLNPVWLVDGVGPYYIKPPEGEENLDGEYLAAEYPALYGPQCCKTVKLHSSTGTGKALSDWIPQEIGELCIPATYAREKLLAVKIEGSGMDPLVRRGANVGIDRNLKSIITGEIYAVYVPYEGLALKRVYYDAQNGQMILRSENKNHPDQIVPIEEGKEQVIGRAVWVMQDI